MENFKVGAVIVAGGLSSRMKDFKPLMTIENKTMIETTINNFQRFGVDEIVVVTGYRAKDIEKKLLGLNIKCIENEKYEITHMFDSVCIGLKELVDKVDFAFIAPSDSPFVQQFTLKKMMDEMHDKKINLIQPSYVGKNGHPLLLRKNAINNILKHDGTMGLQGAIAKMGDDYKNILFADPGIILDADTTNDYINLIEFNENKNCPSVELCRKIQDFFQVSNSVKSHSDKVGEVALNICRYLYDEGIVLDKKIVMAASMLHDVAKGKQKHAEVGSNWLMDMGYQEISKIVAEHMELNEISIIPTEKEIVYLADKLVKDENIVSIKERFSFKEELYKNDKDAAKCVEKRKEQAKHLYCMLFKDIENYELLIN